MTFLFQIFDYIKNVEVDILSIDHDTDINWALKNISNDIVLQGNLNPKTLVEGGDKLEEEVSKIKNSVLRFLMFVTVFTLFRLWHFLRFVSCSRV